MKDIDSWLRRIIFIGLLALPFSFIIILADTFFPYIVGKAFFFRSIMTIVFGLWIILGLRDKDYRPSFSWLLPFLSLFIVSLSLSTILSPDSYLSFWGSYERMEGLINIFYLGAYFLVLSSVFKEEEDWDWWFNIFLASSLFACLWGFLQLIIQFSFDSTAIANIRLESTLGNAIYLAIIALISIWLSLWRILKSDIDFRKITIPFSISLFLLIMATFTYYGFLMPNRVLEEITLEKIESTFSFWRSLIIIFSLISIAFLSWFTWFFNKRQDYEVLVKNLLYGSLIIINFIIILYTRSRGVQLGLIGGVFLACLLTVFLIKETKIRKIFFTALIIILLIAGGFYLYRDLPVIKENPFLSRLAAISWADSTTRSRLILWEMTWQGVKERPLLGWGLENYPEVFARHFDPRMADQEEWFDRSHNVFLDWLIAGGSVGLALYLFLWLLSLFYLWFFKSFSKSEKIIFTSLLAGYFFQNIFVFDNLTSYLFFFTWLAFVHYRSKKDNTFCQIEFSDYFQRAVAIIVMLAMIFILYYVNFLPWRANKLLIEAKGSSPNIALEKYSEALALNTFGSLEISEQFVLDGMRLASSEDIPSDIRLKFAERSIDNLSKMIELHPKHGRFLYIQGLATRKYGQHDTSIYYLERANELSPQKQSFIFELAISYYQAGQEDRAKELVDEAYNLSPEMTKVIDLTINFFAEIKDYERLSELWKQKVELDSNDYRARLSYAISLYALGDKESSLNEIDIMQEDFIDKKEELQQIREQIEKDLVSVE